MVPTPSLCRTGHIHESVTIRLHWRLPEHRVEPRPWRQVYTCVSCFLTLGLDSANVVFVHSTQLYIKALHYELNLVETRTNTTQEHRRVNELKALILQ